MMLETSPPAERLPAITPWYWVVSSLVTWGIAAGVATAGVLWFTWPLPWWVPTVVVAPVLVVTLSQGGDEDTKVSLRGISSQALADLRVYMAADQPAAPTPPQRAVPRHIHRPVDHGGGSGTDGIAGAGWVIPGLESGWPGVSSSPSRRG